MLSSVIYSTDSCSAVSFTSLIHAQHCNLHHWFMLSRGIYITDLCSAESLHHWFLFSSVTHITDLCSAEAFTSLIHVQQCNLHHWFRLSSVIYITDSGSAVSFTFWFMLSCVINTASKQQCDFIVKKSALMGVVIRTLSPTFVGDFTWVHCV
jgi:hypothetical protein